MADRKASLNKKVPAFSAPVNGGKTWKLADAAGKKLVLYFYPKDNTTGCTAEGAAGSLDMPVNLLAFRGFLALSPCTPRACASTIRR